LSMAWWMPSLASHRCCPHASWQQHKQLSADSAAAGAAIASGAVGDGMRVMLAWLLHWVTRVCTHIQPVGSARQVLQL
jgi:hypothetical protein